MTNLVKRSLALILALVLCLSLLPVTVVPVSAASYIYNWGTRGEVATSLSENAQAFYTGNNTYDALSSLPGGTGTSDAPNSNLYKALQNLMVGAQNSQTSYDDTRALFQYTDCQNGGGKISSFYSGAEIGPDWDGGSTWNREHTWPNSKGLEGSDEDDIMMLRPTASSENSSRGNTAYGRSSGYYDPNNASGGKYNLHGDVARIFLYVYVRWGITNGNGEADSNGKAYTTWGSQGVIESLDVLLDWMAEDPVDTWEMGRNDSVQSITGTRNVFVDYPELAFQLFGEAVPATMTTPSGQLDGSVAEPKEEVPAAPVVHKADFETINSTGSTNYGSFATTDGWQIVNSAIHVGTSGSDSNPKYQVVGPDNTYKAVCINGKTTAVGKITSPTLAGGITKLTMRYTFMFSDTKLGATITVTDLATGATYTDSINLTVTSAEKLQIKNYEWVLETPITGAFTIEVANSSPSKSTSNKDRMTILELAWEASGSTSACEHTNTTLVDQKDATCLKDGYTGDTVCAACGVTISEGKAIDKLGHSFADGVCQRCGVKAPETALATQQAYKFGMIQYNVSPTELYYLTGAMDGYYLATTNVADEAADVYVEVTEGGYYLYTYINTVKHYINMVVSNGHVNGAFEATASTVYTFDAEKNTLVATVNDALYWFGTRNDKTFKTVGPVMVEYNGFYCQLYKFVEGNPNEPTCQHTNTKVEGAADATCTAEGHTGATVCVDCGVAVNAGEVIGKLDHNYVEGVCSACGAEKPAVSTTATITFDADKVNRTQYDSSIQVWEENGITVTNNKAASTNNVGDYANPARFYKGSDLKIEYPGMTKIEIETTGKDYATAYQNSITDANATVVVDGTKVTITFAQPVNSFVIEKLSAQARARSITITYTKATDEPACEHSFVDGVCSVCGHKLGDIDGSDALTYNDAVYLLLYTMFPEEYPLNGAYANVDGDQDVDQDDAVYLLLNVLFGDNFYPLYTTPVLPKNEEEAQG